MFPSSLHLKQQTPSHGHNPATICLSDLFSRDFPLVTGPQPYCPPLVIGAQQDHACLQAFAGAVPSAWKRFLISTPWLPQYVSLAHHVCPFSHVASSQRCSMVLPSTLTLSLCVPVHSFIAFITALSEVTHPLPFVYSFVLSSPLEINSSRSRTSLPCSLLRPQCLSHAWCILRPNED